MVGVRDMRVFGGDGEDALVKWLESNNQQVHMDFLHTLLWSATGSAY